MTAVVVAGVALLAAGAGQAYRAVWSRFRPPEITPKGFGVLLPVFLLGAGTLLHVSRTLLPVFAVAAVGAAIYWWDDVGHISRRIRLLAQFSAGVLVALAVLIPGLPGETALIALGGFLGGVANVVLTNQINFFDGADLNSATMNILVALLVLGFGPAAFVPVQEIVLAFVVPFAIWNARPQRLYFGDSGCFVISSLITAMIAEGVATLDYPALVVLSPVVWACFDAVWVFFVRVRAKEDLLSRNFHHIYQKMQVKYGGWTYLLPQLANVAVVLGAVWLLVRAGLPPLVAYGAPALLLPPLLYLAVRKALVDG